MGRVISIASQKGGVGKTTTAINLGAALAMTGKRVLLVDIDPQGNLTSGVGLKEQATESATVYEALTAEQPGDAKLPVLATTVQNLALAPANRNLAGAEIELVGVE